MVVVMDETDPDDYLSRNRSKEKQFVFDRAFDRTTPQPDVFTRTVAHLVPGVLSGFNATCCALRWLLGGRRC
jgi:kinesin family protein 18/19